MDESLEIESLIDEAVSAYGTAATAAETALKAAEKQQPSKEEQMKTCVCEMRAQTGDPCVATDMDKQSEEKMRDGFTKSCNQELAQMPGAMKDQIPQECIKRRTESAGLKYKDPEEEEAKEGARKYIQDQCDMKVSMAM